MASLAEFKASALGQLVGAIINDQENIIRMIALSESGIPAVQAIGKRLIPRMPPDQDLTEIKKNIGRWGQADTRTCRLDTRGQGPRRPRKSVLDRNSLRIERIRCCYSAG